MFVQFLLHSRYNWHSRVSSTPGFTEIDESANAGLTGGDVGKIYRMLVLFAVCWVGTAGYLAIASASSWSTWWSIRRPTWRVLWQYPTR